MVLSQGLLQEYQPQIADAALDLFEFFWTRPYRIRSDCEWADILRCSGAKWPDPAPTRAVFVSFLSDYLLDARFSWRGDHLSSRTISIVDELLALLQRAAEQSGDSWSLMQNWCCQKLTKNRELSAASKLLFFARPDLSLMLVDSNTWCAAKHRNSGLKDPKEAYGDYRRFVEVALEPVASHKTAWLTRIERVLEKPKLYGYEFLLRRVADKHLFIEGLILKECKKGTPVQVTFDKVFKTRVSPIQSTLQQEKQAS